LCPSKSVRCNCWVLYKEGEWCRMSMVRPTLEGGIRDVVRTEKIRHKPG
jgi:hypothetical protein